MDTVIDLLVIGAAITVSVDIIAVYAVTLHQRWKDRNRP